MHGVIPTQSTDDSTEHPTITERGPETAPSWPRRVVISYLFGPSTIPLGDSIARAFEERGCVVTRFDCQREHFLQPIYKRLSRILRPALGKNFDVSLLLGHDNGTVRDVAFETVCNQALPDLVLVLRGNPIGPETIKRITAKTGATSVSWCLYGPESQEDTLRPDIGQYDHVFAIYASHFVTVRHLPILARDDQLYSVSGPREPFLHEVSMVGRRSPRRVSVVRELREFPLSIWGPGWRSPLRGVPIWALFRWKAREIWGQPLTDIYRRSKINLNISVWDPALASGLNLRIVDVPSCGGFLLTDHSDEILEYLTPGREIETWRTIDELKDKIAFYLRHDAARERIARAGYERIQKAPSFTTRVQQLLDALRSRQSLGGPV